MTVVGLLLGAAFAALVESSPPVEVDFTVSYIGRSKQEGAELVLTTLIPRSRQGQEVLSLRCRPKPIRTFTKESNQYAVFRTVVRKGGTRVSVRTRMRLDARNLRALNLLSKKVDPLSAAARKRYLASERWIESDAVRVRKLAKRAQGTDPESVARGLLRVVIDTMETGKFRPENLGAAGAVRERKGDCTDFADLFIALCRARGIPARFCEGYTIPYGNMPQHDWCEIWLARRGWVTMDPFRVESGDGTFSRLRNQYVKLTNRRVDADISGFHYYSFASKRGKVTVSPRFRVHRH